MDQDMQFAAKRLLRYSFQDIKYSYKWLTEEEKKVISEEQFNKMVKWLKKDD